LHPIAETRRVSERAVAAVRHGKEVVIVAGNGARLGDADKHYGVFVGESPDVVAHQAELVDVAVRRMDCKLAGGSANDMIRE
jgi:hypothetical protein